MASINYEYSLDEKILVVYEYDSFNDIQDALLMWCCHQYTNCTFKVYFNNYSHELTHIDLLLNSIFFNKINICNKLLNF